MHKEPRSIAIFAAISIFATLCNVGLSYVYTTKTLRTETFTLISKKIEDYDDRAFFLVKTSLGRYKNIDTFWFRKIPSKNLQRTLSLGKQYSCNVYGWRIPALGFYPNIVSCNRTKK